MERPPFVVRTFDLPAVESAYPAPWDAEKLSFGRNLGGAAGARSLGAWHERLPPGRRTSFTHAHLREEELVYVLVGRPTLRWLSPGEAPQEIELEPCDFVSFPAGTELAHTFWNRTETNVDLFVVGERRNGERSTYPEDRPYEAWRDLEHPLRFWPAGADRVAEASWPAYRVETARLVMRPWAATETMDFLALITKNQAHLVRFMPWAKTLPTPDEHLAKVRSFEAAFARNEDLVYGLFLPDGRAIGCAGLHPRTGPNGLEIGYWIDESFQGRGYVTEAAAALTRLVFEGRRLEVVEIHTAPSNERSSAVPKRLGFRHVGTLPSRQKTADGVPEDSEVYSLTSALFQSSAAHALSAPARAWDALGRRLF